MPHGKQRSRPVIGEIIRQVIALENICVEMVQYHQMTTFATEDLFFFLSHGLGRYHGHHFRLFLFGKGKYELHDFLALVTESFAEDHSLSPSRFQGSISCFYEKIRHFVLFVNSQI